MPKGNKTAHKKARAKMQEARRAAKELKKIAMRDNYRQSLKTNTEKL